jgi:hypothetical protein
MNHDPLCKGYFLVFGGGESCNCDLIAKVRADEATVWINGVELNSYRRALRDAIEVVREFMGTESDDERCDDLYCDFCRVKPLIITAIEALGEQQ